jgi:hypothetical protein
MRTNVKVFIIILLAGMFLSCDETFNPNGPFNQKMAVYAVMSAETDTQYVRVYSTYPVSNNQSAIINETSVSDAQVTITHGATVFSFRDTTLHRIDTSRYRSGIKAYVAYGLRLQAGSQYQLTVVSPSIGRATGNGIALYGGVLIPDTDANGNVLVRVFPGSNARAYVVRRFLEYQVRVDSVWRTEQREIPRVVDGETGEFIYQKPISRDLRTVTFSTEGYMALFSAGSLRLKRIFFVLTQLDDALYAYYNTANGFPDSGTLRLDEPDYTNINGGFGVFAMTTTTVVTTDTTGNGVALP